MRALRKTPRYVKVLSGIVAIVVMYGLYVISPLSSWVSTKSLQFQVKRNIDPVELQHWATNFLAHNPHDDFYGTNLPAGLKKVRGHGHSVRVHGEEVWIFCDSKAGPFLVAGSPTWDPTNRYIVPWKEGIFFVKAR